MTDRDWLRSLPLLLTAAILLIAAAWAFFRGNNNTASIAAFSAGLVILGAWLATAVIDWQTAPRRHGFEEDHDAPRE